MPRKRHWMTRSLLAAALAMSLAPGAARAATDVGVAAAVNPDAFSHFGGATEQVVIGKGIVYNERINTSTKGLVQVLFIDGSTVTVGPGSDLVIDKFVYDPVKGKGELTASFTKGMLRFVGGKLSKEPGAVKFETPVGTLGIRGGMFQGRVGGGEGSFSFLFGEEMTFTGSNGQTNRVFQANNTLLVGGAGGGSPTVRPTRPEDAAFFVTNLSGQGGPGGGATGPSDQQFQDSGIGGANSGNNQGGPNINTYFNNTTPSNNLNEQSTTDVIRNTIQNQNQEGTTPPPQTVDLRVLLPGGYFDFSVGDQSVRIDNPEAGGIVGGNLDEQLDDFVTTATIVNGNLTGVIQNLTQLEDNGPGGYQLQTVQPHSYTIPWFTTPGLYNGVTGTVKSLSDAETFLYTGYAYVAPNTSFFFYDLTDWSPTSDNDRSRMLLLGGTPYQTPEATGSLRSFGLYTDGQQHTEIPFAFDNTTLIEPTASAQVSPLLFLEQNDRAIGGESSDGSKSVWLQTSFQLQGEGADQQSVIVIAAGTAVTTEGGPALQGERRGGSRLITIPNLLIDGPSNLQASYVNDGYHPYEYTSQQTTTFSGGLSTLSGPAGNHLFGEESPYFVIGANSPGGEVLIDTPLDAYAPAKVGATYHVAEQNSVTPDVTQNGGTFNGYAAGMLENSDRPGSRPRQVVSIAPSGFELALNPQTNQLSANMTVRDLELLGLVERTYDLALGTQGQGGGVSAYVNDTSFAAFEAPGASSVTDRVLWFKDTYSTVTAQSYLVSGELLNSNAQIFGSREINTDESGVHAFCVQCSFIGWGAWGTTITYGNGESTQTDNVHLGWWVAGDVANRNQLPTSGKATYAGSAIGNVAKLQDGQWMNYVANGDLDMTWNFGKRRGDLTISDFDGKTFGGKMLAVPGPGSGANLFAGALSGSGVGGAANGSFVGPQPGNAPKGVIGDFGVGNSNWQANGVFGGAKQ